MRYWEFIASNIKRQRMRRAPLPTGRFIFFP